MWIHHNVKYESDIHMAIAYIQLETKKEMVAREKIEKHKLLVNI